MKTISGNSIVTYIILLILLFPMTGYSQEQCLHSGAGNIAPLGIMGSHTHTKGSWMFSYQMMNMNMRENLQERDRIAPQNILHNYEMAPERMNMHMHMLMGMYAISDKVTLMAMFNYMNNHMSMTDRMGVHSKMHNRNIGDASITAMYNIFKTHTNSLQANFGLSIPTGSIHEFENEVHHHNNDSGHGSHSSHGGGNAIPAGMPFMMQTGSGTWDILPSITYTSIIRSFSYGLQSSGRIRMGENSRNYRFGNVAIINSWLTYQKNDWLSFSGRIQGTKSWKVVGDHPEMISWMAPTNNALNTGGALLETFIGSSFSFKKGALKNQRLAIEYGIPLYQNYNGIQMQLRSNLIAGWQISF